jgi:hypothetical protein
MVRIRVDRLAWDRRLSSNPHALAIYLEFVPARGVAPLSMEHRAKYLARTIRRILDFLQL